MAVIRDDESDNRVVVPNYHLHDKNLSLKAKGLLTYMLLFPDFTEEELLESSKDGFCAIRSGIWELENAGYLRIENKKIVLIHQNNGGA